MTSQTFPYCRSFLLLSITIFLISSLSGCSSTKELESNQVSDKYIVDGRVNDWLGKKMLDLKDNGLRVGIQNDTNNIYLCIMSTDRTTSRQMAMTGLIAWFNPDSGKKFGIHYPVRTKRSFSQEGLSFTESSMDIDLLGPEKDAVMQSSTLTSESDFGIVVAFRDSSGYAVLEMKIPRKAKQDPYGIGTANTVAIKIESGKANRPAGDRRPSELSGHGGQETGIDSPNGEPATQSGESPNGQSAYGDRYRGGGRGDFERNANEGRKSATEISISLKVHLVQ